jgi:hypothetical protein
MRLTFLARIRDLGNEVLEQDLKTGSAHDGDAARLILDWRKFRRLSSMRGLNADARGSSGGFEE